MTAFYKCNKGKKTHIVQAAQGAGYVESAI